MREPVKCRACGYLGDVSTYKPSMNVYVDCYCPECGSTNNQHNTDYLDRIQAKMREISKEKKDFDQKSPSPKDE